MSRHVLRHLATIAAVAVLTLGVAACCDEQWDASGCRPCSERPDTLRSTTGNGLIIR